MELCETERLKKKSATQGLEEAEDCKTYRTKHREGRWEPFDDKYERDEE